MIGLRTLIATLTLTAAGVAVAQSSTVKDARDVAVQPARDVGIDKTKVPQVLEDAADEPYASRDTATCAQLSGAIRALSVELGPDFDVEAKRGGSLLKRGSAAVVNTLLPFRGIVREVSGAASADRRLAAATQAGIARRGYLRGIYTNRKCRTGM